MFKFGCAVIHKCVEKNVNCVKFLTLINTCMHIYIFFTYAQLYFVSVYAWILNIR